MHSKKLDVLALTQGSNVPSTRFRWQQYVEDMTQAGLTVAELPSDVGAYAPASNVRRPLWLVRSMAENLRRTLRAYKYDLRFLQRNMTSTLCTWEPVLRRPFVFDVDDAIFLGARGASAYRIARAASLTICGNRFLADHLCKYSPVEILPTAVDTHRFVLRKGSPSSRRVIGWSGSSSGFKYLYAIEPAIKKLLEKHPDVSFKVVSDRAPIFKTLPWDRVLYESWRPDREVAVLHEFSVGIMPLEDSLWARGKCSFKMLTYMSVGLPVVVSPVGMNVEVLAHGSSGFEAKTVDDWVDSISTLLSHETLAEEMGLTGRRIIEEHYARNVVGMRLAELLKGQI